MPTDSQPQATQEATGTGTQEAGTLTPELARTLEAMDAPAGSLRRRLFLVVTGFNQLLTESVQAAARAGTMPPKARVMAAVALPMLTTWLLAQIRETPDGKLRRYLTFLQLSLSSVARRDSSDIEALQAIHDAFEELKDTEVSGTEPATQDQPGATQDAVPTAARRTLGDTWKNRYRKKPTGHVP